jgi:hypothetical protein
MSKIYINSPPSDGRCEACGIQWYLAEKFNDGKRGIIKDFRGAGGGQSIGAVWSCLRDLSMSDMVFWDMMRRRFEFEKDVIINREQLQIPESIKERANNLILSQLENAISWPDDDWDNLTDDFSLNMWYDARLRVIVATIYPVKNGKEITNEKWLTYFYRVLPRTENEIEEERMEKNND